MADDLAALAAEIERLKRQLQGHAWRGVNVQNVLSLFIPGSFIMEIVTYRWWGPGNGGDVVRMIDGLLGLHGGWAAMVVGYHFNSSASSARKDEIIAASAPIGVGNVPPVTANGSVPSVPAKPPETPPQGGPGGAAPSLLSRVVSGGGIPPG